MVLTNVERHRILGIFNDTEFHGVKDKYNLVREQARSENIIISQRRLYDLVNKFRTFGFVRNLEKKPKSLLCSQQGLLNINRSILSNKFQTANKLKNSLVLTASRRTISRYISKMGWRKTRTR
jgi:hypothetical protein